MTDFSKTIATFFRSDCAKYSEFKESLKESAIQEDWLSAVELYRKGILALQKNDVNALEIIKQANDSLKLIVSKKSEKTQLNLQNLSESILGLTETNILESLALIKFNFGMLYESCKEDGFSQLLNEDTFYNEEEGDGSSAEDEMCEDEASATEEPTTDESAEPVTPTETPTEDPTVTQTPVVEKKSGYAIGFEEGRKYITHHTKESVTFNRSFKESLNHIIETALHSESYSYVESYKEGFAAGCKVEESILKEMHPTIWKAFLESKSK